MPSQGVHALALAGGGHPALRRRRAYPFSQQLPVRNILGLTALIPVSLPGANSRGAGLRSQGERDVPEHPGARLDHEYYRDKHMPLLERGMGVNLMHFIMGLGGDAA